MNHDDLLNRLFPQGHDVTCDGDFLAGTGKASGAQVAVIGTCNRAAIGADLALKLAAAVLEVITTEHLRPILLLVDTAGQKMARRDETLCLNAYIAHLAKCLEVARQKGHRILALVHDQAVSAGFLATGLMADACHALPKAEMRVMNLPAMSRVTKIPLERLQALSATSPVFAPGVENYIAMGAVRGQWEGDLAVYLTDALAEPATGDDRRTLAEARGGRMLARRVSALVRGDAA